MLVFHPGLVTVALWLSSDAAGRREVGLVTVRRLAGRGLVDDSPADTSLVPNLALAEDSRAYAGLSEAGPPPRRVGTTRVLVFMTGFCTVTLSAPQYEKLILLLRSLSEESLPSSSSELSSGIGTILGCDES